MLLKTLLPLTPARAHRQPADDLAFDFAEALRQSPDAWATLGLLLDRTLAVGREVAGLRRP